MCLHVHSLRGHAKANCSQQKMILDSAAEISLPVISHCMKNAGVCYSLLTIHWFFVIFSLWSSVSYTSLFIQCNPFWEATSLEKPADDVNLNISVSLSSPMRGQHYWKAAFFKQQRAPHKAGSTLSGNQINIKTIYTEVNIRMKTYHYISDDIICT